MLPAIIAPRLTGQSLTNGFAMNDLKTTMRTFSKYILNAVAGAKVHLVMNVPAYVSVVKLKYKLIFIENNFCPKPVCNISVSHILKLLVAVSEVNHMFGTKKSGNDERSCLTVTPIKTNC